VEAEQERLAPQQETPRYSILPHRMTYRIGRQARFVYRTIRKMP
jgi:hypothetical protein